MTPQVAEDLRQSESLPVVLVVDDQFGCPELFADRAEYVNAREMWLEERLQHCQRFGLVPPGRLASPIESPVARAIFVSGLSWAGDLAAPDKESVLAAIDRVRLHAPAGLALVLLDLQFDYGKWNHQTAAFESKSPLYGVNAILPAIRERFGIDPTSPDGRWTSVPVVVMSAAAKDDVDNLIRTRGARGMLPKRGGETDQERRTSLRRYIEAHGLLPDPRGTLIGRSLPFLNALASARRAASGATSVLVCGESGTGKELLARYIHEHSPKARAQYCIFHVAGRSDDLQEGELFGHWVGSFTDAKLDRPGLLEEANGGSLLIDEIGDVGLRVQNALMRPLQERITSRIGRPKSGRSAVDVPIDVLFIFATNKNLHELAEVGLFKPDLLARLEEVSVTLPPLRERAGDMELLASALLAALDDEIAERKPGAIRHQLSVGAIAELARMPFEKSNVRELRNKLLEAVLANPAEALITPPDLGRSRASTSTDDEPERSNGTAPAAPPQWADALRQCSTQGWRKMTLGELESRAAVLRGAAPRLVVALLEASHVLTRQAHARRNLAPMMEQFWGCEKMTAQRAERALLRILQSEWQDGTVALVARESAILMEDVRIREIILRALKNRAEDDDG